MPEKEDRSQVRARRRNWTLGGLNRDCVYTLWWNARAHRWDISVTGEADHGTGR